MLVEATLSPVSHRPHVSVLNYVQLFVLTSSHHTYPVFSFAMATCVPVVSFLASHQGVTRYCVRAKALLGLLQANAMTSLCCD